ncbi:unnamed protein product, partial [Rotaria magnacalcarata]
MANKDQTNQLAYDIAKIFIQNNERRDTDIRIVRDQLQAESIYKGK